MAKRPNITTVASGYFGREALNDNFQELQAGFDNTLSLDGSTPNAMQADLDLNGFNIANAGGIIIGGQNVISLLNSSVSSAATSAAQALIFSNNSANSATAAAASAVSAAADAASAATSWGYISPYTTEITAIGSDLLDGSFVAGDIYDFGSITTATTGSSGSPDGFIVSVYNNLADIQTVAGIDADVTSVAGISADVSSVASIDTDVTTVSGISSDVTTVAGISANVTSVAGNSANIAAVGAIASDVSSVASISSDVTAVAGISTSDLAAVAAVDTEVGTLGAISADITTAAGISSNITTVATNDANITTVAGISSDVSTVSGISANVTTVAGISSDVTAIAADATDIGTVSSNIADVNTVAGITSDIATVAGDSADITTVATDIANVNTVATNMADVNSFGETYRIGATDPTTSLDVGDLFFNSTTGVLKVYDGVGWTAGVTAGSGFLALTGGTLTGTLTLDADPTTALGAATKQYVDAEVAGLVDAAPATLDTLNELAAALGDDDDFATTTATNLATKLPLAGGTMTGDITFNSTQLFDGRDVSADGTKLDGIAAGATNYADAEVDTHLNTGSATTGEYLQWNGTDYDWAAVPAGYADADVDTHLNTGSASSGEVLQWDGSDYDWAPVDAFPSGTKMLFQQTSAPTGWTKDTTHDNKALRVVSGTAGSGGSSSFTSAFSNRTSSSTAAGGSVGYHTLSVSQMPSHNHTLSGRPHAGATGYLNEFGDSHQGEGYSNNSSVKYKGGSGSHNHSFSGSSHSHTLDMSVQYVDLIIATKD